MRVDLSGQNRDEVGDGHLEGPDAIRYVRRTTRTKRRDADELITAGSPLVLYYWAGGQLDWFDGQDAASQWKLVRPHVTSTEPQRKGELTWTAGRWEDDEGHVALLLTGHC